MRGTLLIRAAAACALLLLSGCLFLPGPKRLEGLLRERPRTPHRTTVFKSRPDPGERGLEELRRTLAYWSGTGSDGRSRWRGVLKPQPDDLYARAIDAIDRGADEIRLVAYKYDAFGLNELTLVDYYDGYGAHLGYDYVEYHEIPAGAGGPAFLGYDDLRSWEYPQLLLDAPIYSLIGLKELAGEVLKSPLSALDSGWFGTAVEGRNPLSPVCFERAGKAFCEDWKNGIAGLTWRFRARGRHTPVDLVLELLGAIPVIGPIFDHKSPPDAAEIPARATRIVAVSPGIHAGGRREQHTFAWKKALEELRPEARVLSTPYRFGGLVDTAWSMFNISHGMSYDAASQLVFEHGIRPGSSVVLVGFSGSVELFRATSRLLRGPGIRVDRLVGVAGPCVGYSCAAESHLLLGGDPLADPVVLSAHALNLLFLPIPENVERITVSGAGGHYLPYFPDGATRAPASGYAAELERVLRQP